MATDEGLGRIKGISLEAIKIGARELERAKRQGIIVQAIVIGARELDKLVKATADTPQRRRSDRSPDHRDSYRDRSRSPSRDREYRSSRRDRERSPANGHSDNGGGYGSSYDRSRAPAPQRSFEERQVAKEQMMSSIKDSSQQERRVYVGNLSYDVKWHHLKDYMRTGKLSKRLVTKNDLTLMFAAI